MQYKCKTCGFDFDIKIVNNEPQTVTCPKCKSRWYVKLETFLVGKEED